MLKLIRKEKNSKYIYHGIMIHATNVRRWRNNSLIIYFSNFSFTNTPQAYFFRRKQQSFNLQIRKIKINKAYQLLGKSNLSLNKMGVKPRSIMSWRFHNNGSTIKTVKKQLWPLTLYMKMLDAVF